MENKRISEVFGKDFLTSNFWLYWRTMFAFEEWHSALEMKLYLHRFIHHLGGMPDFSALMFTKYNQYESLVLPLYHWLLDMEAAYQLLQIERGVPEVFNSTYDVRTLLAATSWLRDGKELSVPGPGILRQRLIGKLETTEIGELLEQANLI